MAWKEDLRFLSYQIWFDKIRNQNQNYNLEFPKLLVEAEHFHIPVVVRDLYHVQMYRMSEDIVR